MQQNDMIAAIQKLFPGAQFQVDFTIKVTSGTATLLTWNNALGTQPTQDQMQTALDGVQLAGYKQQQISLIAAASITAQTSGFTSSALGSEYSYPSDLQDQANLNAVATSSTFPIQPAGATYAFWCTSSTGVSGFVSHTAAQIQRVGMDGLAAIMAQKAKQWDLTQQIAAATTVAAVQAIVW